MAVSSIKAVLACDVQKVWETVTSREDYAWRSDLSRIESVNEREFIEYTVDGVATRFRTTAIEPCKRWEFDMENSRMRGHWAGIFTAREGHTEIVFTETVTAKKLLLRPFVRAYLKKQQACYVSDLKKALL